MSGTAPPRGLPVSWPRLYRVSCLLAALGAVVAGGCVTTSATQVLLYEGRPTVRAYEGARADMAERDDTGGGSIKRGGCPVCAW